MLEFILDVAKVEDAAKPITCNLACSMVTVTSAVVSALPDLVAMSAALAKMPLVEASGCVFERVLWDHPIHGPSRSNPTNYNLETSFLVNCLRPYLVVFGKKIQFTKLFAARKKHVPRL